MEASQSLPEPSSRHRQEKNGAAPSRAEVWSLDCIYAAWQQKSRETFESSAKRAIAMHAHRNHKIWFISFLLLIITAGCSDRDDRAGNPNLSAPGVASVTPPDGKVIVCPETNVVSATFNKAMNPATINSSTFTVTGPGGASVDGTVSYVAATHMATFTPTLNLALDTAYDATITTGVMDAFGNHLAANFEWSFTTPAVACPPLATAPTLGTACAFGILAAVPAVSSTGPTVITGGDVGIWPAASITGFPPATLSGTKHMGDATAMTAQGDLTVAYNNAAGAAGGAVLPADIGGLTLPPGVYRTTSGQPSLGITGILTLDGGGDPNAVWIFQVVSTVTTASGNSQVNLIGSAQAQNVFWQVGSSATLGTNTSFTGNIMALASITLDTGATLNGRALAQTGAVTLDSNPVNIPPCP